MDINNNNIQQLKKQAYNFYRNNNFSDAIEIYEKLFKNNYEIFDEWDFYNYIISLKNLKKYNKAKEIAEIAIKKYSNFKPLIKNYTWILYHADIKSFNNETTDEKLIKKFLAIVYKIIENSEQIDQTKKNIPCVYTICIFKLIDFLKNQKNVYYKKIKELLEKINPDFLSINSKTKKDKNGKDIIIQSDKEKWYLNYCKCLYETKEYEKCIEVAKEALSKIKIFTNDNEIWIRRNKSLSYYELAKIDSNNITFVDKAINEMEYILKYKFEWFILYELSLMYKEKNEIDLSINYAIEAFLLYGDISKKIELLFHIAELLEKKTELFEAVKLLIMLSYLIRANRNWNIPEKLKNKINNFKLVIDESIDEFDLEKQIKKDLIKIRFSKNDVYLGKIDKIFDNGKSGFIKSNDNNSYYFQKKSFVDNLDKIRLNNEVKFILKDSFDKKKNRISKIAALIYPV